MPAKINNLVKSIIGSQNSPHRSWHQVLRASSISIAGAATLFCSVSNGQVPNVSGQMAPPIPGVGHHYLGLQGDFLSETVNPATGSVSVHLTLPTPPSRGINIPFSLIYNSSGVWQLQYSAANDNPVWVNRTSADNGIGWSYSLPLLTLTSNAAVATSDVTDGQQYQVYSCDFLANYVFEASDGSRHELPLSPSDSISDNPQCQNTNGLPDMNYLSGADDPYYSAITTGIAPGGTYSQNPSSVSLDMNPPPVTVFGLDGTVYKFTTFSQSNAPTYVTNSVGFVSNASTIEDRNGNIATIAYTPGANVNNVLYQGSITYTDTSGRNAVSVAAVNPSTGTSSVAISGYSQPLTIQWGQVSRSFAGAGAEIYEMPNIPSCQASIPNYGASTGNNGSEPPFPTAIQSITLPNGQIFTFSYDSLTGLLQKITYPTGAYIEYTWGPNPLSEVLYGTSALYSIGDDNGYQYAYCDMTYGIPAVVERQVSYDGINVSLDQTFQYNTAWPYQPSQNTFVYGWNSKTTTVTTTDNVDSSASSVITYSYEPVQSNWTNLNFGMPTLQDLIPVEASVQTQTISGQILRTVTKNWSDEFSELCNVTTLDNNTAYTSGKFFTYGPGLQVTDDKEFDYGLLSSTTCNSASYPFEGSPTGPGNSTPTREVKTAFENIQTLSNGGTLYTAPSQVQTYDAGTLISQTNISYDQYTLASVNPPQHDSALETSTGSLRGNPTALTKVCWPSCPNVSSTYTWDTAGQISSATDATGNTTCFSHQDNFSSGPGSSICDPNSGSTGTDSYLTVVAPPAANGVSHTSTYGYSLASGDLIASTDPNNQTTLYQYNDPLNRITEVQGPSDPYDGNQRPTTAYTYNDSTPSITTSVLLCNSSSTPSGSLGLSCPGSSLSKTTVAVEDGIGHVKETQLTSDNNGTTSYGTTFQDTVYDGSGNVFSLSNPYRSTSDLTYGVTHYTFDPLSRMKSKTDPESSSYVQTWSYSGPTATFTDEDGNQWQKTLDSFGRLIQVLEPTGSSPTPTMRTTYGYDGLDDLVSVNQAGDGSSPARQRSFIYDSLGRLTSATNPESGTTNYNYQTSSGQLCSGDASSVCGKKDARGTTITYAYGDSLNRLTGKSYSDSTPPVTYSYDTSTVSGACNDIGQLTGELVTYGSTGSLRDSLYCYDPMGHLLNEVDQRTSPGSGTTVSPSPSFTYDLAGDLTSSTDGIAISAVPHSGNPVPIQLGYSYDGAARLIGIVSNWNGGLSDPKHPANLFQANFQAGPSNSASYGPVGLAYARYGINSTGTSEAVTMTRVYDQRSRLVGETDAAPEMITGAAAPSSATITMTGSEQISAYSSGSIAFSGTEQNSGSNWDSGSYLVTIGTSNSIQVPYGPGSTPSSLASYLASHISCSSNSVQAASNGATAYFQSCSPSTSNDYSISAVGNGHSSSFSQYSFALTASGSTMTPIINQTTSYSGIAATFSTTGSGQVGSGAFSILIFSTSGGSPVFVTTLYWSSTDTTSTLASRLAAAIGSCSGSGAVVGAIASGSSMYMVSCQPGTSYVLEGNLDYSNGSAGFQVNMISTPASGAVPTITFSGAEQSAQNGQFLVEVTELGYQGPPQYVSVSWGSSSTPSTLASALATGLGACSSNPNGMDGLAVGATVYLGSCNATASYSISAGIPGCSCSGSNPPDFAAVVTTAPDTGQLPAVPGATFDSGTVSLAVDGTQVASASYGSNSTPASIANALASTGSNNSLVNVQANGTGLTITSKLTGDDTDYSYSITSSSNNPATFPAHSFTGTAASGTLSGGSNASSANEVAYQYAIPAATNCNVAGLGFDGVGNLLCVYDSVMGTWNYSPDHLNRLLSGTASAGPYSPAGLTWAYDGFDNRWGQGVTGSPSSDMPFPQPWTAYPDSEANDNRIGSTSLSSSGWTYDAAGNVLFDGNNSYAYDAEERLCAVESTMTGGPSYTGYLYDGDGNRIASGTLSGLSCNFSTNGFSLVKSWVRNAGNQESEWNGSGVWQHTNIFDGSSLMATYSSTGSDTYFALNDWLGTKRAEVSPDGCFSTFESLPYGDELTPSGNCPDATEQHFTGKERDLESGNDYFGARYYGSSLGRFLSPDPKIGSAHAVNPQSWNRYAYALDNPDKFIDPDGKEAIVFYRPPDPNLGSAKDFGHIFVYVRNDKTGREGFFDYYPDEKTGSAVHRAVVASRIANHAGLVIESTPEAEDRMLDKMDELTKKNPEFNAGKGGKFKAFWNAITGNVNDCVTTTEQILGAGGIQDSSTSPTGLWDDLYSNYSGDSDLDTDLGAEGIVAPRMGKKYGGHPGNNPGQEEKDRQCQDPDHPNPAACG